MRKDEMKLKENRYNRYNMKVNIKEYLSLVASYADTIRKYYMNEYLSLVASFTHTT